MSFVTAWDKRTGREHYVTAAAVAMDPNLTTARPSPAEPTQPAAPRAGRRSRPTPKTPRRAAREPLAATVAADTETPAAGGEE